MKTKIITTTLALAAAVALVGCGKKAESDGAGATARVDLRDARHDDHRQRRFLLC